MSSINEILKNGRTEKVNCSQLKSGSNAKLCVNEACIVKHSVIRKNVDSINCTNSMPMDLQRRFPKHNTNETESLSERDQSTQFSRNFLLFYSLLQNHLADKSQLAPQQQSTQHNNLDGNLNGLWSVLWMAKLQELRASLVSKSSSSQISDNFKIEPTLKSPSHTIERICNNLKNNNNDRSCDNDEANDVISDNGTVNTHCSSSTRISFSPSTNNNNHEFSEDRIMMANENCNIRSRELWKKWSMETPNHEIFLMMQKRSASLEMAEQSRNTSGGLSREGATMSIGNGEKATKTNVNDGFECTRCGKMFSYAYYRDKHLKYTRCVDNGDRKFPCSFCPRSFEKRDRLRIHVLHVHENHRPHVCSNCGKAFSQSSSLNKHLRVHSGERPYQCPFCTKCFTASSILRTHIRQHSGEKPFKCIFCGKSFASHAAHDSHVRRTHPASATLFAANTN